MSKVIDIEYSYNIKYKCFQTYVTRWYKVKKYERKDLLCLETCRSVILTVKNQINN